jgi:hypothetical protein
MSMLELTKNELDSLSAITPNINDVTKKVMEAIPYPTVSDRMKATIAISHITLFASQFRRNIELWDGTPVPINSIAFIICDSGAGKDSSHRAAKRCFSAGYDILKKEMEKETKKRAIKKAETEGEELPDQYEVYKKYMVPVPPVETSVTTGPGLVKLINDMEYHDLGSNSLYSGEFSDELSYNQDMIENIKILSELYDLGIKEVTYTKGQEFRSGAVDGQPMSALLIGSPTYLLYDEATKRKFQIAFMSKLARRSWFCYSPEKIPEEDFSNYDNPIQAMLESKEAVESKAKQARSMMKEGVEKITRYHMDKNGVPITLDNDVFHLFEVYKRYNSELADSLPSRESTSALIRRHLQWKALKLAGAFAIMDMADTITSDHYIEAMQFCELLDKDMAIFEYDLNKSYYERFADYIRTQVTIDNKAEMSVHDIKKHGFLSNITKNKLQEMITLCAGYDKDGVYSIVGDSTAVRYEPIIKTDVISISFKPIDIKDLDKAVEEGNYDAIRESKNNISFATAYGYEVADTTFPELNDLLRGNFAYSSFQFQNGVRGKDNIIGSTKWIVFDVDDSLLSAEEAHFMLSDINHHIALSSDPNNYYKFRVLVELDSNVELSAIAWKHFSKIVSEDLAIKADPLPQSQIFFSYAGRPVYSVLDAEPLVVRDYIMEAKEKEKSKENNIKLTNTSAKKALLQDPTTTFSFLFEAKNGEGSRSMIRAAYYAKDLGASLEETLELIQDANEYWEVPMESSRLQLLLEQITRLYD